MLKLSEKFLLAALRKFEQVLGASDPSLPFEWCERLEMRVTERESKDAALLLAVIHRNEGDVRRLVSKGADPNAMCVNAHYDVNEPATAIHIAALMGEERLLPVLLNHGKGNADARDRNGQTPLMHITEQPRVSVYCIADILIDAGADVNARDAFGRTAMHIAAAAFDSRLCRFLLEHGADPRIKDNAGKKPVDVVDTSGDRGKWMPVHALLTSVERKLALRPETPKAPAFPIETTETINVSRPLRLCRRNFSYG